jgi:hypothetical protein
LPGDFPEACEQASSTDRGRASMPVNVEKARLQPNRIESGDIVPAADSLFTRNRPFKDDLESSSVGMVFGKEMTTM